MREVDHVTVELSVEPKWWFAAAFTSAAWACALTSFVSECAAERLSDKLCGLLARHGHIFKASSL